MNETIVFIHGAWMTPRCWEPFESFFTSRAIPVWRPRGPITTGQ